MRVAHNFNFDAVGGGNVAACSVEVDSFFFSAGRTVEHF